MKNELKQSLLIILGSEEFGISIRNSGKFRFPTNYLFRTHSHGEFEMNYVDSGNCVMEIGGRVVPLKEGQCVLVAPGIPHCFWVGMIRVCRIVQLEYTIFLPKEVPEFLGFVFGSEEAVVVAKGELLGDIMENICRCYRDGKPEPFMEAQVEFCFAQLFVEMVYRRKEETAQKAGKAEAKVDGLLKYINQYYDSKLNLEKLADDFGISSRSVRKYFENTLGISYTDYITMLRMEKAKELLWNTRRSITDISFALGYSSSQYFSNVFKKYTGTTPAKFRCSWRGMAAEEKLYE